MQESQSNKSTSNGIPSFGKKHPTLNSANIPREAVENFFKKNKEYAQRQHTTFDRSTNKTTASKNIITIIFEKLKNSSKKKISSFLRTVADISLIKIGDLLLLLDSHFQKKKYYRLTLIASIVCITWVVAAIFTASFSNSTSSNNSTDEKKEISAYTPTSKSSSLKPLQDYYLFESKLDIENMTDMIVSSSDKDKNLKTLYNAQMKNDLQNTEFFRQSDRVIHNEIKKLIQ